MLNNINFCKLAKSWIINFNFLDKVIKIKVFNNKINNLRIQSQLAFSEIINKRNHFKKFWIKKMNVIHTGISGWWDLYSVGRPVTPGASNIGCAVTVIPWE